MATLLWQRSISSEVSGVKNTFSGWDSCMSKAYCKWPAIVGIIIASLIVVSILWCVAKILCCGAECCFCCMSCMRCCSCCGDRRSRNKGYDQPAATPRLQPYPQYQSAPPMYAAPMQQPAQAHYAQYDAPSGQKGYRQGGEDALPAMPGWDNAATRRVEVEDDDLEMEKLNQHSAQAQPMLQHSQQPTQTSYGNGSLYGAPQHQSSSTSYGSYGQRASNPYESYGQQQQTSYNQGYGDHDYAPSVPPSYRTAPPSVAGTGIGRKPVQGSWRDL